MGATVSPESKESQAPRGKMVLQDLRENGVPKAPEDLLANLVKRENAENRDKTSKSSSSPSAESRTAAPQPTTDPDRSNANPRQTKASRVTVNQLREQVDRAKKLWPFIGSVERKHGLPAGYLLAIGSRETNLRNIVGDGGHGIGVWQRDIRYWPVDRSYLGSVRQQARDAASLLAENHEALGSWKAAAAAYNAGLGSVKAVMDSGRSADVATTGGDYGADVMARLALIKPQVKKRKSMAYLTQLAEVARRTGFPVVEEYGWKWRGHGGMGKVRSIITHHDAADQSPTTFNTVIRDGRAGLPGPLSQFALRRDGTIHVVAAGKSYHAGSNKNPWLYGNSHSIGIEAGNDGVGEPWTQRQLDAYVALCAELVKEFGLKPKRVRGHREITSRKIDPAGINMNWFRSRVTQYINNDRKPQGGGAAAGSSALILEGFMERFDPGVEKGTLCMGIPERGLSLQLQKAGTVGAKNGTLKIYRIAFMDGDGNKRHVKMKRGSEVPEGDPWWGDWLNAKNHELAVLIDYSYTGEGAYSHIATASWRRDY